MLILTRHERQKIFIGEDITIGVIKIYPQSALLSVTMGPLTENHHISHGEPVSITDNIIITVMRGAYSPNQVKVGIDAPRSINIRREEVAVLPDQLPPDENFGDA